MGKKRVAQLAEEQVLSEAEKLEKQALKAKKSKILEIPEGNVYIRASYNNTTVTATDETGNVLAWATAGSVGFKGPRKATPYAASRVIEVLLEKLEKVSIKKLNLLVSGIGAGRDSAIRALTNKGLNIASIKDITPLPHNGCKPPKPRRV